MKYWKFVQAVSLLLVVYASGVQPVFAITVEASQSQFQEWGNRYKHSEGPAILFKHVSIIDVPTPGPENKLHGFGTDLSNVSCGIYGANVKTTLLTNLYQPDKRKLIAASIFPFHFFW